jgi:uncharacterized membrane protein YsdA (DUF1294 family)
LQNFTIGLVLMVVFGTLVFVVRARDGKDVIKSDFAAQAVVLILVALLMGALGFIASGIFG